MSMLRQKTVKEAGEYVCPYCFSTISLSQVHYECTTVSCPTVFAEQAVSTRNAAALKYVSKDGKHEIDPERSSFLNRNPHGDDAIIAKRHIIRGGEQVCNVCRRPVYLRVCPICHNPVPNGAEEEGNRIIVILGPKGVGKSHFMAVLINQLQNLVSNEFNGSLSPANDATAFRYKDKFYNKLFVEKCKLPATKSFGVSDDSREPLIYYLRLYGDNPRTYTLVFFDTAGEDLVTADRIRELNIHSFIAKSAGIIYLIDPLQTPYVNSRINIDKKPNVGPDVTDVLNNIANVIRTNNRIRGREKIGIPLAVALTKSDVLFKSPETEEEDKVLFGLNSSLRIPREYGKFDMENFDQISVELEEYLRRILGQGFLNIVDGFAKHSYFAVSSLGCNPTGDKLPRGVSPMRVEDPLLWLLNQEDKR
ncbi:MAG: GTPase domain-containing protein [Candidatus Methanomethylophilaceae archaeon]|nr:GTPase domain-containing protein [Candidatus Methanomethylophilaceae archaeon]